MAREAHYHRSCQRDYVRRDCSKPRSQQQTNECNVSLASDDALDAYVDVGFFGTSEHKKACDELLNLFAKYIEKHVLNSEVVRMTMLKDRYLNFMQEHAPLYRNDGYQTSRLKNRIIARFGDQVAFRRPTFGSDLVYQSNIDVGAAIEMAYESAASEKMMFKENCFGNTTTHY